VKLPRPEDNLLADRIVLRGDDHDFDNTFFVVPPRKQQVNLLYAGDDAADDQQGPQFYLKLATTGEALREVDLRPLEKDDAGPLAETPAPQLVVATRKIGGELGAALKDYVERGGTLVLAPIDREAAAVVAEILDDVELPEKPAAASDYSLLGEIDFSHPLFAPFANSRYSDFTKIHFWKHRSLALKSPAATRVVARFDNGEPALLERTLGKGRVIVFAGGWHPEESQLALSTKFVPLIAALLDLACGSTEALASVTIGHAVGLPSSKSESPFVVHKPDGGQSRASADATAWSDTDQPGIYSIGSGADEQRFAVNLAAAESNTAPLELEQLEQMGVKTGAAVSKAERLDRIRQQRDTELESRQKIWRWLIVGAVAVLILETFWAGRAAGQIAKAELVA
jgi:hypothetical protein